jgi:hypothetical protein
MRNPEFNALVMLALMGHMLSAQPALPPDNQHPNPVVPDFYRGTLADIASELAAVKRGKVETEAHSPGGRPVYAVYYGAKEDFHSRANYNSAVGARNPAFYARKTAQTRPVVFLLGPVHGQEAEGIVGLVNLIHLAETGFDHRGRAWPELLDNFNRCRVIILPCGNPDGRARCPYDSFVGLPVEIMTRYGQGTRVDGTSWGWPLAKSVHPMRGDVGMLGAYFNDEGINPMHDDFFFPMADETRAILRIAAGEAPDLTVSLHSYELPPSILQPDYLPLFMKQRVADFANHLNSHYKNAGLPHMPEGWTSSPGPDDPSYPPATPFNLVSALHHISGTMAFTFECSHGTIASDGSGPIASHEDILDIQLHLYQEMFAYILQNRLIWE